MPAAPDASRRACAACATYGCETVLSDDGLDRLLAASGLRVIEGCPFNGRVREVYVNGLLGIRAGLSPEWARWLKLHGLGHHLLHRGNHLYVSNGLHLWQEQELEAELFAGAVLLGPVIGQTPSLPRLASVAKVPLECVLSWQAGVLHAHETQSSLLKHLLHVGGPLARLATADGGAAPRRFPGVPSALARPYPVA